MSRPYRILLTTFGSFGDLHPYMAIALELNRRGHVSVIGTSERYRSKIESAGIEFAPVRPDLPADEAGEQLIKRVMDPARGSETLIREVVMGNLHDSYTDTLAAASGADILVSHVLTYAAPIAAEKLGLPWVFTALQPIVFFSGTDPSMHGQALWLRHLKIFGPKFYRKLMSLGFSRIAHWSDPVYALRQELGLQKPALNPIFTGQFSPHLNLALFSKEFAPAQPDWPANTLQTGFPFYDHYDLSQQPMSQALTDFLAKGDHPIVFTLGTAAVRNAGSFYTESAEAVRLLNRRAVLLTGTQTGNELSIPSASNIISVPYAPYSELFSRASVNVHQGGIGTTAQALRAGKPMLVVPFAHDQPDNAARMSRLGVAKHIDRSRYRADSASRVLKDLLENDLYTINASSISQKLSAEDGAADAATRILKLLD